MKLFFVVLSVGLVSLIAADNLDKIDSCMLSCMLKILKVFGCKGNDDEVVICGCSILDSYHVAELIAGCTENTCNFSFGDLPVVVRNKQQCSDAFGSPTGSPDGTLPRSIPRLKTFTSSSLSSATVSSDGISGTNTPISTSSPKSGSKVSPTTGALMNTPVSSTTSNDPTAPPTASPTPPSNGPELSPAIIATIVVSTVTVIGVPLWLLRCYRWRKSQATSSAEENAPQPPVPAEKGIEPVVTGYNELPGSTEMRHEMLSNTPGGLPLHINTMVEIDSDPLRKTILEVSLEDESPGDAVSQAVSLSATTAVSCPEPQQFAKEKEETNTEVPEEDAPGVEEETETELEVLQRRQGELERKRRYLQQIQEIDEEEGRLQQRIDELQLQSQMVKGESA